MISRESENIHGELLTLKQTTELSNLGICKTREIAEMAGAVRKIGKCYRINKKIFFDYIENHFSVQNGA